VGSQPTFTALCRHWMKMARLVFHRFIFVFSMHDKSSKCSQEAQMLSMDTVDEDVPIRPRAIV
jgi:hypothetical protein